jgi:hypothetical protein
VATFLCATESFPNPLRGNYLGFAAEVGQAGVAIGTPASVPMQNLLADV